MGDDYPHRLLLCRTKSENEVIHEVITPGASLELWLKEKEEAKVEKKGEEVAVAEKESILPGIMADCTTSEEEDDSIGHVDMDRKSRKVMRLLRYVIPEREPQEIMEGEWVDVELLNKIVGVLTLSTNILNKNKNQR